jgi:hypothetical protein
VWQYDGNDSSGISRDWGAADLVVALGTFNGGTVLQQAGTLMHELGHNLGLHHNGYTDENDLPHYMSVMNYAYQVYGIETTSGTNLDYARIEIAPVDEQHLNENAPFPPAGNTTSDELATYLNPRVKSLPMDGDEYNTPVLGSLKGPLDLDGYNGIETDVGIDLNGDGLWDHYPQTRNDWATLKLGGGPLGLVGDAPSGSTTQRTVESFGPFPPCRAPLASGVPTPESASPTSPSSPSIPPADASSSAALPTPSSSVPVSIAASPQASVPSLSPSDQSDLASKAMTPDPSGDSAKRESTPEEDPAEKPDSGGPVDSRPADSTDGEPAEAAHSRDPADAPASEPPAEEPSKPADSAASAADENAKDPASDGSSPDSDPAASWPWPF